MFPSSLDALLKLSKPTFPQKPFPPDFITMYILYVYSLKDTLQL